MMTWQEFEKACRNAPVIVDGKYKTKQVKFINEWSDIWYAAVATLHIDCEYEDETDFGYNVEYKVYAMHQDGGYCDETNLCVPLEKAEIALEGNIRRDGCSEWRIENNLHLCGRIQADKFAAVFKRLYKWANELMPDNGLMEEEEETK